MLTTMLARDPAVPARDLLLDPVAATERLARLFGIDPVTPAERVRAKYRIGESLRVVYRLRDGERTSLVSARTFTRDASAGAFRRACDVRHDRHGAWPAVVHDGDWATVWWTFPADRRLRGLGSLLHPDPTRAGRLGLQAWRVSEVVEYAPERSVTIRASAADGQVRGYVKAYAPDSVGLAALARRYDAVARALRDDGLVAAPAVLGRDVDALALEAMPGTTWAESAATGSSELPLLLERLGRAIAMIHQLPVDRELRSTPRFGRLLPRRVVYSAELVARARPELAGACRRLAAALGRGPGPGETVLLHGDCHPKNALLDVERLALVDLDQAGFGQPAADIGSLLARIRHGVVLGEHDERNADALAESFLCGYRAVRDLPAPPLIRWHTAAALVAERALRSVNRVQPEALMRLSELLACAEYEVSSA